MKLTFAFLILLPLVMAGQYKDGKKLLSDMHKKNYGKYCNSLVFKQTTNRYVNDSLISGQVWSEYLKFPDKLRIDIGDTAKGNYMIFKNDSAYRYRKFALVSAERDSNMIMLILGGMYHRPKKEVLQRIEKFGVKMNEFSEQQLNGKACYVIGAKESNETKPQIWVNKKTLYVERFVDNYKGSVLDVRILERQKACKGEVETKLAIYADGKLLQEELYFDIKYNELIPAKTFDTSIRK